MQFLSNASHHLSRDLIPDLSEIMTNRIVNYLSFYNSYHGQHQYYSPYLYSHDYLQSFFNDRNPPQQTNYQHIITKVLLASSFHQHMIDPKGTYRFLSDMYTLTTIEKQDIVEGLLKVRCKAIRINEQIQSREKLLPVERRRNFYILYPQPLPAIDQLTQIITFNPFYRLPNINKILTFTSNPSQKLSLPLDLEEYCLTHSIKIKLLDPIPKEQSSQLIQYLYHKDKNKILIHENINYQKALYDTPTPVGKQRTVKGKVVNPLYTKLMPQEILVMTQRLPIQSLANKDNKEVLLEKMKSLLSLEPSQDLIDPTKRLAMSSIQKNYKHEQQSHFQESKFGFLIRRYITQQLYEFNRKSDINTPFTNPKQ